MATWKTGVLQMKTQIQYSGHGPDVLLVFSPSGEFRLWNVQTEEAPEGVSCVWKYSSRTGCSAEGFAESDTHLLFPAGTWRVDAPSQPPTWAKWPMDGDWEFSVSVRNFNSQDEWFRSHIVLRREIGGDIDWELRVADAKFPEDLFRGDLFTTEISIPHCGGEEKFRIHHHTRRPGVNVLQMTIPPVGYIICDGYQQKLEVPQDSRSCGYFQISRELGLEPLDYGVYAMIRWGRVMGVWYPHDQDACPGWNWVAEGAYYWRANRQQYEVVRWEEASGYEYKATGVKPLAELVAEANEGIHCKKESDRLSKLTPEERMEEEERKFFDLAASLAAAGVTLSRADSTKAGNCPTGTEQFCSRFGLGDEISVQELISHPQWGEMCKDRQFRRVILAKGRQLASPAP